MNRKLISLFLIANLLLPTIGLAKTSLPETPQDAREVGGKAAETVKKELPGITEKIWKEEVWPVWKKMGTWFWDFLGRPAFQWLKENVLPRIKKEVEVKKPEIKKEFQKEKKELKEEAPSLGKSLWERFKELIK